MAHCGSLGGSAKQSAWFVLRAGHYASKVASIAYTSEIAQLGLQYCEAAGVRADQYIVHIALASTRNIRYKLAISSVCNLADRSFLAEETENSSHTCQAIALCV